MIKLRDYQQEAVDAVLDEYRNGVTRQLVVIPTGGGKTVVFAYIAKLLGYPTLVLAHRDELVRQAADKFEMVWPEASVGIVKAQEDDHQGRDVVVASVQTLSREERLSCFGPTRFGFLVVDEAHHAVTPTYLRVFDRLGFMAGDAQKLLIGVTATGFRGDGIGLGRVFEKITFQRSIVALIRAGYLVDIKALAVHSQADIGAVKMRGGDFDEKELASILNSPMRNEIIVKAYLEHAAGRRTIAFTVDVQHAKDLAAVFRDCGVKAESVWGEMPYPERVKVLEKFSAGQIEVVTNCGVLTEGVDIPATDCIIMARPTTSRVLYMQMLGRGLRLYPGKEDCLVIDVCDNHGKHDALTLPTLFGVDPARRGLLEALKKKEKKETTEYSPNARTAAAGGDLLPLKTSVQEVDVFARSAFRWVIAGDIMRLPVGPGEYIYLVPLGGGIYNVEHRQDNSVRILNARPLDIGYAQGLAEEYLREKLGWRAQNFASRAAPWRKLPPTQKQLDLLLKLNLYTPGMTRGEASDTLEKFFAARQCRRRNKNANQTNRRGKDFCWSLQK
ncbi:DEAD/DEAH box helicase [Moorellaceae bacterium AZ2]